MNTTNKTSPAPIGTPTTWKTVQQLLDDAYDQAEHQIGNIPTADTVQAALVLKFADAKITYLKVNDHQTFELYKSYAPLTRDEAMKVLIALTAYFRPTDAALLEAIKQSMLPF